VEPSDLLVSSDRAAQLRAQSSSWPSLDLTARQLCDLELLLNGGFAPLRGFMTHEEYESVTQHARLPDETIWPTPVTLDLPPSARHVFSAGDRIALRDREGVMLAVLNVTDVWTDSAGRCHVGGLLDGIQLPVHHDFKRFRLTPAQARETFRDSGWTRIAGFQPLSPAPATVLGPAIERALALELPLFVHLVTGSGGPNDPSHFGRVREYAEALRNHPAEPAMFAMLPLWIDATGARALVLRAAVAKNFGCTHLLVPGEIPEEARKHAWEIGIELVPLPEQTVSRVETPHPAPPPEPRRTQGFTVFFTGLSGSGKSTIANALLVKLLEAGDRKVSLLDGDVVRTHLSSELGFSKKDRALNVRRIGYVASEITKHGGIAICAPIAPYDEVRKDVRRMIEAHGGFILIHVSTPLDICEQRDRKGLYAKARAGLLPQFTGISDPYETPEDAAVTIDTERLAVDEAVTLIVEYLRREGYLVQ
jgi:sulfate adenylyltransferase